MTNQNQKSEIKTVLWVVAQLAEHRTVTAAREGSIPLDPPKGIADSRLAQLPIGQKT